MSSHHRIQAWNRLECLLEMYDYAPGPASSTVRHSHDEYQFCLSLNFPGTYFYRGVYLPVPVGALSVLHPGEPHSAHDPQDREGRTFYLLLQAPVSLLVELASQSRRSEAPFFEPTAMDRDLVGLFTHFHHLVRLDAPTLQLEHTLYELLARWMTRHADLHVGPQFPPAAPAAMGRARAYLLDNLSHNVTTAELAAVSGLSPYRLHRQFARTYGLPPHRYRLRERLERARRLLAEGLPPAQVAVALGFADQSHFGRHSRRAMGVSPGRYGPDAKAF